MFAYVGLFGSNASNGGGFGPTGLPNRTVVNASAMAATDDDLVTKLTGACTINRPLVTMHD